jgi:hypothetical protein
MPWSIASRVHRSAISGSFILSYQPGFARMCALHCIICSSRRVRGVANAAERDA